MFKFFLKDCVDEMSVLQLGPVKIEGITQSFQVDISCFICDTPACAFVKQVKGSLRMISQVHR